MPKHASPEVPIQVLISPYKYDDLTPARKTKRKYGDFTHKMASKFCKHEDSCATNALKGLLSGFLQGYTIKVLIHLVLNFVVRRKFKDPLGVIK
jgi:hypothetical protein